jgi:hypothetical protein
MQGRTPSYKGGQRGIYPSYGQKKGDVARSDGGGFVKDDVPGEGEEGHETGAETTATVAVTPPRIEHGEEECAIEGCIDRV